MSKKTWLGRAFGAALLAGSLGACDFIDVTAADPNIVSEARLNQLWVGTQVNSFFVAEGQFARISAVWLQQLSGVDRQFALLEQYNFTENEVDEEFAAIYTGGGLIDIAEAKRIADREDCAQCKGVFQIHEAYLIGMAASTFGAIPYSEAVSEEFDNPSLDPQEEVYAAAQALLDSAIVNLSGGADEPFYAAQIANSDLNFGGARESWISVANTLKARFYMHWVEAQMAGLPEAAVACGGPDCIAKAQAAAMNGIMDPSDNWRGIHSGDVGGENNFIFQFFRDRPGYAVAGAFMVDLLMERNDPRLRIYFDPNSSGQVVGSSPNAPNTAASVPSLAGAGGPGYNQPIVLCAENQFILAETYYYQGKTAAAQQALQAGVACQTELFNGFPAWKGSIPVPGTPLTGAALLEEIITQKYIALFLNGEAINDYKRTCFPPIETYNGQGVPRRLFYGRTERQTNTSIPDPNDQPLFNTNDPNACNP